MTITRLRTWTPQSVPACFVAVPTALSFILAYWLAPTWSQSYYKHCRFFNILTIHYLAILITAKPRLEPRTPPSDLACRAASPGVHPGPPLRGISVQLKQLSYATQHHQYLQAPIRNKHVWTRSKTLKQWTNPPTDPPFQIPKIVNLKPFNYIINT